MRPSDIPASAASAAPAKSPLVAAIVISFAITAGSVLGTVEMTTIEDALTGRWLTRPLAETQQRNTLAIAALEHSVGTVTRDIDFVAARASAAIRRSEDHASDRLAHLDAEIAALKDEIAGIQHARLVPPRPAEPQLDAGRDVTGLRSSLHDLTAAHTSAVAAITRRLDRIEVMVGLSTDMTSSVSDPAAQRAARRAEARRQKKQIVAPPAPTETPVQNAARPERGHIFNMKPISQQGAPLRLSRLPG